MMIMKMMRGRTAVVQRPHKSYVMGSNPIPATNSFSNRAERYNGRDLSIAAHG